MQLDGSDRATSPRPGEGLPYGLSLSPDGQRVAFHLASPEGYQVWTSDLRRRQPRACGGASGSHLYFGTNWSPDGKWVLYVDCHYQADPGHDWCDVCIGRADGSEHRVLHHGPGDVVCGHIRRSQDAWRRLERACWTHDGRDSVSRAARPAQRCRGSIRPAAPTSIISIATSSPSDAQGGTEICRLDPRPARIEALTHGEPPNVGFSRQRVARRQAPGFLPRRHRRSARRSGRRTPTASNPRQITQGQDNQGADHPRWLPQSGAV